MSTNLPYAGSLADLPAELRGGYVAIGNFDGVHPGHRAVLASAIGPAHAAGRAAIALTFEPHPRAFFSPDRPMFRLSPPQMKVELLHRAGADAVVVVPFNAALAGLSAEDFVRQVLVEGLGVRGVVVGQDFHFGRGRQGTPARLAELGAASGFETVFVEQVGEGTAVSASSIRALLCQGAVEAANALLGYRWFVEGTVVHGAKRGRELGYPTANLEVDPGCGLRHGIYAVRATVDGFPGPIGGVASFGRRPMFDNGPPLLETFLFDFSGDLYGRLMKVEFLALLRGEETFDSLEALIAQMDRDSLAARAILAQPVDLAVPSLLG